MKRAISVVLFATFLATVGSCKRRPANSVIGVSFDTLQTEYWVASIDTLKSAIERSGASMQQAIADNDENRQLEQVRNFIAQKVGGIIVAPKDAEAAKTMVKLANKASIPIVFYNRPPAENDGKSVAIVADNRKIARDTVLYMCQQARKAGGRYTAAILVGHLGDINARGRLDGFKDAIAQNKDLFTGAPVEVATNWKQDDALNNLKAALRANPDINFIFSSSDFLFPSVISALESRGQYKKIGEAGHVLLGGFDGDNRASDMLVAGFLDADGVQDMRFECEQAVKAVFDLKAGKTVPAIISDPGFVIHQDNLNQMKARMWGANLKKQ